MVHIPLSHRRLRRAVMPPKAPGYSRFVGWMKIVLPSTAALLLGLVVAWPSIDFGDGRFVLDVENLDPNQVDTQSMSNPRFLGTDARNRPFTLTADTATQASQDASVVALEAPTADMTLKDGTGVVMDADLGFFRQKDDTLDLMGGVNLYHENGYEMHTPSARLFLNESAAKGDEVTTAQGPAGTIRGEGFRMDNRGRTVIFTGQAHAVLEPAKAQSKKNKGK